MRSLPYSTLPKKRNDGRSASLSIHGGDRLDLGVIGGDAVSGPARTGPGSESNMSISTSRLLGLEQVLHRVEPRRSGTDDRPRAAGVPQYRVLSSSLRVVRPSRRAEHYTGRHPRLGPPTRNPLEFADAKFLRLTEIAMVRRRGHVLKFTARTLAGGTRFHSAIRSARRSDTTNKGGPREEQVSREEFGALAVLRGDPRLSAA